jgi:hypothetical protein
LDIALLKQICTEIEDFVGVFGNQHQFARGLPKLTKYLNSYPVPGLNNSDQWMKKLDAISKHIQEQNESGALYTGRLSEFVQTYLLGKKYEALLEKEAMRPEMEELERYQEERRIARGQKPRSPESKHEALDEKIWDEELITKQLSAFKDLLNNYHKAQNMAIEYQDIKEMMAKAISLPVAESDLLMRYQTTLERRLSSAIGELLALQRANR